MYLLNFNFCNPKEFKSWKIQSITITYFYKVSNIEFLHCMYRIFYILYMNEIVYTKKKKNHPNKYAEYQFIPLIT